jgi:hypothetical protein
VGFSYAGDSCAFFMRRSSCRSFSVDGTHERLYPRSATAVVTQLRSHLRAPLLAYAFEGALPSDNPLPYLAAVLAQHGGREAVASEAEERQVTLAALS